jgi:hypothetical protein
LPLSRAFTTPPTAPAAKITTMHSQGFKGLIRASAELDS